MHPDPEAVAVCQKLTLKQVSSGQCRCTLCGKQATVAMCWIPNLAALNILLTPFGHSRVFGYGICRKCEKRLNASKDESLHDLISQRLIKDLWNCNLVMTPREQIPSIFLN